MSTSYTMQLVNMLTTDPDYRYQRHVRKSHVKRMVNNWDPSIAGVAVMSLREDGKMVPIDGNHRVQALKQLEAQGTDVNVELYCQVYEGLSLAEEAEMFTKLNGQRANASPLERFDAGVLGGDPDHVTADNAARAAGTTVGPNADQIKCAGALVSMAKNLGLNRLDAETIITMAIKGSNQSVLEYGKNGRRREIVEGAGIFIDRALSDPKFNTDRLLKVMKTNDPDDILRAAKARCIGSNRASNWVAQVIHERYNEGLRTQRIAEWKDLPRRSAQRTN